MDELMLFLTGFLAIFTTIKMLLLEKDVNTLYRAICWLDSTKQERTDGGAE